jgi:hypothetical protein
VEVKKIDRSWCIRLQFIVIADASVEILLVYVWK